MKTLFTRIAVTASLALMSAGGALAADGHADMAQLEKHLKMDKQIFFIQPIEKFSDFTRLQQIQKLTLSKILELYLFCISHV